MVYQILILIRTGNTYRISNLIWQIIYSEIFFVKKMWPDFNKNDFKKIIKKFKSTNRNFGGLNVPINKKRIYTSIILLTIFLTSLYNKYILFFINFLFLPNIL